MHACIYIFHMYHVKTPSLYFVAVLRRAPFFSVTITEDAQGYLEGLDQVDGAVISLNRCAVKADFVVAVQYSVCLFTLRSTLAPPSACDHRGVPSFLSFRQVGLLLFVCHSIYRMAPPTWNTLLKQALGPYRIPSLNKRDHT